MIKLGLDFHMENNIYKSIIYVKKYHNKRILILFIMVTFLLIFLFVPLLMYLENEY